MAKVVEIDYAPYPHQSAVHDSEARIRVVMWPIRAGKDYCSVAEGIRLTLAHYPEWSQRNLAPKWHGWFIGPTYPLTRQLWRDLKRMLPAELIAKEPNESEMYVEIKGGGLFEMKSADRPERLVASGLDFAHGTECGLWKPEVWSMSLRGRLSSPGRLGRGLLNGTPQGQYQGADPHWFWSMVLQGRDGVNQKYIQSFYWFEDKVRYNGMDHPIMKSEELELVKKDESISDRMFKQNYLGECLPMVGQSPIVPDYNSIIHVNAGIDYNPAYPLYRSWDFGRNYPVCTFHQLYRSEPWHILGEVAPIGEDLIDEEFAQRVVEYTARLFPKAKPEDVVDIGDFEANQHGDNRRMSTSEMLKSRFKISLQSSPTEKGQEDLAINVLQARSRLWNDRPGVILHPRAVLTIQAFAGGMQYDLKTVADIQQRLDKVREIHPFIDIFDTLKYFIVHVIHPRTIRQFAEERRLKRRPTEPMQYDEVTGRPY